MPDDKQIRLSIDDSALNKVRRNVEGMYADLARQSRQYTTSGKEALGYIEDQIKATERRIQIEERFARSQIEEQREAGNLTDAQASQQHGAVTTDSRENNLLVELLREQNDLIRQTSQDEIRNDRAGVQSSLRESQTLRQIAPEGDPIANLRETLQNFYLGNEDGKSGTSGASDDKKGSVWKKIGRGIDRTVGALAGSQNEFSAVGAGISAISPGFGILANRLVGSADSFEKALADRARLSGSSIEIEAGRVGQFQSASHSLGLSGGQQAAKAALMSRSFKSRISDKEAINLMAAEAVTGVGGGQINELLGVARYDEGAERGNTGVGRVIGTFEKYLRSTDQNIAVLPEILSTYTQVSQDILNNISNQIDQSAIVKGITAIGQATGQTGVGLQATTGAIQGLANSKNPIIKSLLLASFAEQNPTGSLFDVQADLENPLLHREATAGAFKKLRKLTGGGEGYKQGLFSTFEGRLKRSRIREILDSGGDFTQIADEVEAIEGGEPVTKDYLSEAPDFIGTIQQSNARLESYFEEYGKKAVDYTDKILKTIVDFFAEFSKNNDEEERRLAKLAYAKYLSNPENTKTEITPVRGGFGNYLGTKEPVSQNEAWANYYKKLYGQE